MTFSSTLATSLRTIGRASASSAYSTTEALPPALKSAATYDISKNSISEEALPPSKHTPDAQKMTDPGTSRDRNLTIFLGSQSSEVNKSHDSYTKLNWDLNNQLPRKTGSEYKNSPQLFQNDIRENRPGETFDKNSQQAFSQSVQVVVGGFCRDESVFLKNGESQRQNDKAEGFQQEGSNQVYQGPPRFAELLAQSSRVKLPPSADSRKRKASKSQKTSKVQQSSKAPNINRPEKNFTSSCNGATIREQIVACLLDPDFQDFVTKVETVWHELESSMSGDTAMVEGIAGFLERTPTESRSEWQSNRHQSESATQQIEGTDSLKSKARNERNADDSHHPEARESCLPLRYRV